MAERSEVSQGTSGQVAETAAVRCGLSADGSVLCDAREFRQREETLRPLREKKNRLERRLCWREIPSLFGEVVEQPVERAREQRGGWEGEDPGGGDAAEG